MSTADTFEQSIEEAKARREAEKRAKEIAEMDQQAHALTAYIKLCDDRMMGRPVNADDALDAANNCGATIDDFTRDVEARRARLNALREYETWANVKLATDAEKLALIQKIAQRQREHEQEIIRLKNELGDMQSVATIHKGRWDSFTHTMKTTAPAYVRRLRDKIETNGRRLKFHPDDPAQLADADAARDAIYAQIKRDEALLESLTAAIEAADSRLLPPVKKGN